MAGLQAWTDRPNTLVAVQRRYHLSAAEAFPALPRTEGAASLSPFPESKAALINRFFRFIKGSLRSALS